MITAKRASEIVNNILQNRNKILEEKNSHVLFQIEQTIIDAAQAGKSKAHISCGIEKEDINWLEKFLVGKGYTLDDIDFQGNKILITDKTVFSIDPYKKLVEIKFTINW